MANYFWITTTPESGTGGGEINVRVEANQLEQNRATEVIVSSGDSLRRTINVHQKYDTPILTIGELSAKAQPDKIAVFFYDPNAMKPSYYINGYFLACLNYGITFSSYPMIMNSYNTKNDPVCDSIKVYTIGSEIQTEKTLYITFKNTLDIKVNKDLIYRTPRFIIHSQNVGFISDIYNSYKQLITDINSSGDRVEMIIDIPDLSDFQKTELRKLKTSSYFKLSFSLNEQPT